MSTNTVLTTVDNPYDPFEEFDKWFEYDMTHGYNTCGLVDRLTRTSDEFGDAKQEEMTVNAIDDFLDLVGTDLYRKVTINDDENADDSDESEAGDDANEESE